MRIKLSDGSVLDVTWLSTGPRVRAFKPKPDVAYRSCAAPQDDDEEIHYRSCGAQENDDGDSSWECQYCATLVESGEICSNTKCREPFNPHDVISLDDLIEESASPMLVPAQGETELSRAAILMGAAKDVLDYMNQPGLESSISQRLTATTDVLSKLSGVADEVQSLLRLTDSQATDALKRGITDLLLVHIQPGLRDGGGCDDGGGGSGGGSGASPPVAAPAPAAAAAAGDSGGGGGNESRKRARSE